MAFAEEKDFEKALIELLSTKGWEKDVLRFPTEEDLIQNWANILFENNREKDRLNDYRLTRTEMQQLIEQIIALKTPFKLNDPLVPFIGVPEGLGQLEGLVQGDMECTRAAGHLLCHHIHVGIGYVQRPAHIPDGAPGSHGAEGDDLGHVVGTVFILDVLNDLLPPPDAEVDVNIRHGDPLGVEESLKVEGVFHRVHVGDGHAVGHHG